MVIIHDDEVGLFPWFERTQAVVDIQNCAAFSDAILTA